MSINKRILLRRIGKQLSQELLASDKSQLHSQHRPKISKVMRDNSTPIQLSLLSEVDRASNPTTDRYLRE